MRFTLLQMGTDMGIDMGMPGHLGTMVRLGRRLESVEVVLYFDYDIYGLHGVWNSSGCIKWHLRVSELSGKC